MHVSQRAAQQEKVSLSSHTVACLQEKVLLMCESIFTHESNFFSPYVTVYPLSLLPCESFYLNLPSLLLLFFNVSLASRALPPPPDNNIDILPPVNRFSYDTLTLSPSPLLRNIYQARVSRLNGMKNRVSRIDFSSNASLDSAEHEWRLMWAKWDEASHTTRKHNEWRLLLQQVKYPVVIKWYRWTHRNREG